MALSDMLSRKFAEQIFKSAVTMTAANYTAKGIDQGVQKLLGAFGKNNDNEPEPSDLEQSPGFKEPNFD